MRPKIQFPSSYCVCGIKAALICATLAYDWVLFPAPTPFDLPSSTIVTLICSKRTFFSAKTKLSVLSIYLYSLHLFLPTKIQRWDTFPLYVSFGRSVAAVNWLWVSHLSREKCVRLFWSCPHNTWAPNITLL